MKRFRWLGFLLAAALVCLCAFPAAAEEAYDDLDEVIGVVEDNVYINEYFDIAYMLPDDTFQFATEEELELQGRISKAVIKSDEFDVNDLPETWIEMMATSTETNENITNYTGTRWRRNF